MRLFGIRATSVTLGLGLVAAGLGVLGAGSSGPAATKYEVTAALQWATGGKVFACYAFLLTFPAEGCGGIEVRGVDFNHIPNVERYPSGAQVSQAMRLVGTWDGTALTLTESPQPAASDTPLPQPCTQELGTEARPGVPPRQLQVGNDRAALEAQGIMVLETVTCGDTLGIGVAVADPATVHYLESHYGKVSITGWLRPLPGGP